MLLFSGCNRDSSPIDKALRLRESIISSNGTTFGARITADYGQTLYSFELDCTEDSSGNLSFTVVQPETITGITGIISQDRSALTFDDKVLAFPPLTDGQFSPVIAPYLFIKGMRGGYISACGKETDGYCIYIDDNYFENQLKLQVYTNIECIPVRAEIIYRNQRILTIDIVDFSFL